MIFLKILEKQYSRNDRYRKIEASWKSHLHYHLVFILSGNETSIDKVHFECCGISYQESFVQQKHLQTRSRYK